MCLLSPMPWLMVISWSPLLPSLFTLPALSSVLMTEGLFSTSSSHFSLGQPEIMILKSLRWFIQRRRRLGPCGSSLDNGFHAGSQASTNEQFKSHRWKEARTDSLLSIRVRTPAKKRSLCSASESCRTASPVLWRGWREPLLVIYLYFKTALQRWHLLIRSE